MGLAAVAAALSLSLSGCSSDLVTSTDSSKTQSFGSGDTSIRIASGSENREVEQAIKQAAEVKMRQLESQLKTALIENAQQMR